MNRAALGLLILGLFAGALQAWPVPQATVEQVRSTEKGISFVFHLTRLDTERLWIQGEAYLKVGVGDAPVSWKIGDPLLPRYEVPFAVPPGRRPVLRRLEVLQEERVPVHGRIFTYGGFGEDGLSPLPGPPPEPREFPDAWAQPPETALRRHLKYGILPVTPVRWTPSGLRVARRIRVEIAFEADPASSRREVPYQGADPFQEIHERTVINPEQVRAWLVNRVRPARTPVLQQDPFATASAWIRIPLTEPGVYAVTYEDLLATGVPGPFESAGLNLFSLGPDTLPSRMVDSLTPVFRPVAFLLKDGDDGVFGPGDTLFFYNPGVTLYRWNGNAWSFYRNPYADTLVFWLALGSQEPAQVIEEQVVTEFGDYLQPQPFTAWYRHEKDLINIAKKGLWWQGEALIRNQGASFTELSLSVDPDPTPVSGAQGVLRCQVIGGAETDRIVELWFNDSLVQQVSFSGIGSRLLETPVPLGPHNTLKLVLRADGNEGVSDFAYLDYVELAYPTRQARPDRPLFLDVDGAVGFLDLAFGLSPARWVVEQLPDQGELAPRFYRPLALGDTAVGIRTTATTAAYVPVASVHRPPAMTWRTTFTLRQWNEGADLLIVAPRDFLSTLEPLIQWKRQNLYLWDEAGGRWQRTGGRIRTVAIEDVFQEFGYGMRDPAALHYFVKYAYLNAPAPAPTYLLLVGDGTYDYRNLLGAGGNLIPPYEPFYTLQLNESSRMGAWDGYFGEFTGDLFSEVLVGRLPVRNRQELSDVINKILAYERGEASGPWRNRVVLVADDDYWADQCRGELMHTRGSDEIYREAVPRSVETRTLYLIEYPHEVRSLVGRELFLQDLNQGSLIFNVFGHGNPILLFHEAIFSVDAFSRVNAGRKNPLVVIASCKTGAFDRIDPVHVVGEYLAVAPGGIATISATTVSYANSNAAYARALIGLALDGQPHPLGELLEYGKNNRFYALLGDPSVPLQRPAENLAVTLSPPADTLQAYHFYDVEVQGGTTSLPLVFGYHADQPRTYVSCAGGVLSYVHPGDLYYRGWTAGEPPTATLMAPFVSDTMAPARVLAYRAEAGVETPAGLVGLQDSLTLVPAPLPQDAGGPQIRFLWSGQELRDSTTVPASFFLEVEVSDEHGVYLSPDTLPTGELGLMLVVDEETQRAVNLTSLFYYVDGSATRGRAVVPVTFDQAGYHRLRVVAYDNLVLGDVVDPLRHRSQEEVVVFVPATQLVLQNLLAYPNPWRGKGPVHFTFFLTQNADRVQVKVYTVTGRLVWSTETSGTEGFNDIVWDGRDDAGDIPANGLYYFKVVAESGGETVSRIEKLLILR